MESDTNDTDVRTVKETQTRSVRGGIIVLLITRQVDFSTGATVGAVQEDCVAANGAEAADIVGKFLTA